MEKKGVKSHTDAKQERVKPGRCKKFVQDHVAAALPEAMQMLLEKLKTGDLATLKTLWMISDLDKEEVRKRGRRGTNVFARRLLKRLEEYEARSGETSIPAKTARQRSEEG